MAVKTAAAITRDLTAAIAAAGKTGATYQSLQDTCSLSLLTVRTYVRRGVEAGWWVSALERHPIPGCMETRRMRVWDVDVAPSDAIAASQPANTVITDTPQALRWNYAFGTHYVSVMGSVCKGMS